MHTFLVVYRGTTISDARLIALSADPDLVADVTTRMLQARESQHPDPVTRCVEEGRIRALRLIHAEASGRGE